MKTDEYRQLDGVALADLIRRREVSAAEVLDAANAAIDRFNSRLNAVISRFQPDDLAIDAGPFAGVPFLMKDIGSAVRGTITGCASAYFTNVANPARTDGELTARFRRAGLQIIGKTNLPELGFNIVTESRLHGPARNPYALAHSPGGSSGGAAAAVAAGLVPMAHASDGAGSIRCPAAACGLIGMKPSRGLLPQGPDASDIYGGLVSEGVITRTVRDAGLLLDAVMGGDPGAPYASPLLPGAFAVALARPPRRLRIGISTLAPPTVSLAPCVLAAVEQVAAGLAALGHRVTPAVLPVETEELLTPQRVYEAQVCAQAAADWQAFPVIFGRLPEPDELEPINRAAAERGLRMTAAELVAAVRAGHAFARRWSALWRDIDVLLTPVLAGPAPNLGQVPTDHEHVGAHVARMLAVSPFSVTFNVTGEPAIALPTQVREQGLPIGVQLAGPLGTDATLVALAAEMESANFLHLQELVLGAD